MATERYRLPNGYEQVVDNSLYEKYVFAGPFLFLWRGMIGQAICCAAVCIFTFGLGHLIYIPLVKGIIRNHLLQNGYVRVDDEALPAPAPAPLALSRQAPHPGLVSKGQGTWCGWHVSLVDLLGSGTPRPN